MTFVWSQEKISSIEIKAPKGWKSETIKLPAPFAKDMNFTGEEIIYFAPGMFTAQAKDFFTYVFLLSGKHKGTYDQKAVKLEILKYYRGLAKAVGGPKANIDTTKFTLSMTPLDIKGTYTATLNWVEPFKTKKPQKLNFKISTWDSNGKQFLFALVSPSKMDSEVWKSLKTIEAGLTIK
jgi:hypothetical protein